MSGSLDFTTLLLVVSLTVLGAAFAGTLGRRLRVPAPALMLVVSAVAVLVVPGLHAPSASLVEHVLSVALVLILFDGGMGIGWSRFRGNVAAISLVGVAGTFLTTALLAVAVHAIAGLGWYPSTLLAAALAPTDPAVVFSVLGQKEVAGRSGTLLEGESGANDPVGIALVASLVTAGGLSGGALAHVAGEFALQMLIGCVAGFAGGRALLWFSRRVPLVGEGLYPLRNLACVLALFALTVLLHGSGFLAVFVAGIVMGEERAPYKREVEHFHSALSSLGEIVAFVVLGLTVDLGDLARTDVWIPALAIALVLALVVRPLVLEPLLLGSGLERGEKTFVMFAGLKGAVPILLGSLVAGAHVADGQRLYGIVVVVVIVSVAAQGSLTPSAARLLHVPMRSSEAEPWSLGVRLREQPEGAARLTVRGGSRADGRRLEELDDLPESVWVSLVVRQGALVPVRGGTELRAGDVVLVLADPHDVDAVREVFEGG